MTDFKLKTDSIQISLATGCDIKNITSQVNQMVMESTIENGIVNIFVVGSTGSITTIEYEPGVVEDLKRVIDEIAPQVGDMVCYARQSGITYDSTGSYKSHCDIVVSTKGNQIEVIGGNVNQAVTKKILKTGYKGTLLDSSANWFAVIKNNI